MYDTSYPKQRGLVEGKKVSIDGKRFFVAMILANGSILLEPEDVYKKVKKK